MHLLLRFTKHGQRGCSYKKWPATRHRYCPPQVKVGSSAYSRQLMLPLKNTFQGDRASGRVGCIRGKYES